MASSALKLREKNHTVYFKPLRPNDYPRWRYHKGRIERNPHLGGYRVHRGRVVRPIGIIPGLCAPLSQAIVPGSQNFTTPGTFTFTLPAYNTLNVSVAGSGAGGGAFGSTGGKNPVGVPGGSGGSGGLATSVYFSSSLSGVVTIIVGAAGAAQTDGNTSSFNGVETGFGGTQGLSNGNNGVNGAASGGNVSNVTGGGASGGAGDNGSGNIFPGSNGFVNLSWS